MRRIGAITGCASAAARGGWIRILSSLTCSLVVLGALAVPIAAGAQGPADNHPHLPAAATVWCLAKPKRLAEAALGLGIEVGHATTGTSFAFAGTEGTASDWALSSDKTASADFERACKTAFVAFRHAGVGLALYGLAPGELAHALEGESGESFIEEAAVGLIGVVAGAGLTGLGGLGAARIRSHHADAEELRRLDAEFGTAFECHLADRDDEEAMKAARLNARLLRDAIGEWTREERAKATTAEVEEEEESKTLRVIGRLLDGEAPKIGNFNPNDQVQVNRLRTRAAQVHRGVAVIAARVGKFTRLGARKPSADTTHWP
jgi:hypothetical protein